MNNKKKQKEINRNLPEEHRKRVKNLEFHLTDFPVLERMALKRGYKTIKPYMEMIIRSEIEEFLFQEFLFNKKALGQNEKNH